MEPEDGATTTRWAGVALVACRITVGSIFLTVGALKLGSQEHLVSTISAYKVVPTRLIVPMADLLPILEIGFGLMLLVGFLTRFSGIATSVMMAAFLAGLVEAKARGLHIDCGCSLKPNPASLISWSDIVGALGLLGAAAYTAWRKEGPFAIDRLIFRPDEEDDEDG